MFLDSFQKDKVNLVVMTALPAEQSGTKKCSHWKVLILCLLCSMVYMYLYSNLTIRTVAVNDMMKDTLNDLQKWKDKVEDWVRGIDRAITDASTTSTIIIKSKNELPESTTELHNQKLNLSKNNTPEKVLTLNEKIAALREAILSNKTFPLITLFTTWQTNSAKFLVHNNTIKNWKLLSPFVRPVLFTDEEDLSHRAKSMGWEVLPVTKSAIGIPILKYMYIDAMAKFKSTFYAYSNGDILYTNSLIETLVAALDFEIDLKGPALLVGQRTNVKDITENDASSFENIAKVSKRGTLFTTYAEDYFITTASYPWNDCAEVVIGRRAYDNWLVLNARKHKHVTVDCTKTLLAVHQTTKAGNFEGHATKNSNYNDQLLVKMYRRVQYGAGLTSCTSYYTSPSANGPVLNKRNVHRSCFPL